MPDGCSSRNLRQSEQSHFDYNDAMASTSIGLSDISNKQAVLRRNQGIVTVEFCENVSRVGEPKSFSLNEAVEFGQRVYETGEWEDFPFGGIPIATVKILGKRLKEFATE